MLDHQRSQLKLNQTLSTDIFSFQEDCSTQFIFKLTQKERQAGRKQEKKEKN